MKFHSSCQKKEGKLVEGQEKTYWWFGRVCVMKGSHVAGSCGRGDGLGLEKQLMIPPHDEKIKLCG